MEYAWGGTLEDYLENHATLSAFDARVVTIQLVDVLKHLHEKQCIHRDVKAENVLLMSSKNVSNCKLADLGYVFSLVYFICLSMVTQT